MDYLKLNNLKHIIYAAALLGPINSFAIMNHTTNTYYAPNITLGGFYGNNNNNYGQVDALLPLNNDPDKMLFFDIRGLGAAESSLEINAGLGYRWLSDNKSTLMGVYSFFDRKRTKNQSYFSQITIGGEYMTKNWSYGMNVYLPVGKTENIIDRQNIAYSESYNNNQFITNYGDLVTKEVSMKGIDAEIGYSVPFIKGLDVYAGGYYFDHKLAEPVAGPKLSFSYNLMPVLGVNATWLNSIDLQGLVQHDNVRGTQYYVGLSVSITLDKRDHDIKYTKLENKMKSFVRRDLDIVSVDDAQELQNIKKLTFIDDNGTEQLQVGQVFDDTASLVNLDIMKKGGTSTSSFNHFVIADDMTFEFPSTFDADTPKALFTLSNYDKFTGPKYSFVMDGKSYTLDLTKKDSFFSKQRLIAGAQNIQAKPKITFNNVNSDTNHNALTQNLIQVAGNNDIQSLDLHIENQNISYGITNAQYTRAEALISVEGGAISTAAHPWYNYDSANARDPINSLLIKDISLNGRIDLEDAANIVIRDSSLTFDQHLSTTVYLGGSYGENVPTLPDLIQVIGDISKPSTLTIFNNIFNVDIHEESEFSWGTGFIRMNGHNTALIEGNTFGSLSDSSYSVGIWASNSDKVDIIKNKFGSLSSSGGDVLAIFSHTVNNPTVSENTFGDISGAIGAWGIYARYADVGQISKNKFGIISGVNAATGIQGYDSGSLSISDNTFGDIQSSSGSSQGVYGDDLDSTLINNNEFGNISGVNAAYGILAYGSKLSMSLSISNNNFAEIKGEDGVAYGLLTDNVVNVYANANQIASVVSTSNNAYGFKIDQAVEVSLTNNKLESISSNESVSYGVLLEGGSKYNSLDITSNTFNLYSGSGSKGVSSTAAVSFADATFNITNNTICLPDQSDYHFNFTSTISPAQRDKISDNTCKYGVSSSGTNKSCIISHPPPG